LSDLGIVGRQNTKQSPEYTAWARRAESLQRRSSKEFSRALDRAKKAVASGRPELAVGWCRYAASVAWFVNPGFFYCHEMEQLLAEIGQKHLRPAPVPRPSAEAPRRFLHVMSTAFESGGHTRAVSRWIEICAQHAYLERHSILISMQGDDPLPVWLRDSAQRTGGEFIEIPSGTSWLQMAAKIRSKALEFDAVVLHTHPNDPLPNLAFHDQAMPVLFFDHADDAFVLGLEAAQVVAELRAVRIDFAARYGSPPAQKVLLPLPLLDDQYALCGKSEARTKLGLPTDAVIALTIGHKLYFTPIPGYSFAAVVQSLCAGNSRVLIVAVGLSESEPFPELAQSMGGRFMPVGRITDRDRLELYYRAADVYMDAYPIGSGTAVLDAALHGLPVQRLFNPYERLMWSDDPGLDSVLRGDSGQDEYVARVLEWLEWPEEKRLELGACFRAAVLRDHCGASWKLKWLEPAVRALKAPSATSRQRTDGEEYPSLMMAGFESCGDWPAGMLVAWAALSGPLPLRIRLSGVLRSIKPLLFDTAGDRNFRKRLLMFMWLVAKCLPDPMRAPMRKIGRAVFKRI